MHAINRLSARPPPSRVTNFLNTEIQAEICYGSHRVANGKRQPSFRRPSRQISEISGIWPGPGTTHVYLQQYSTILHLWRCIETFDIAFSRKCDRAWIRAGRTKMFFSKRTIGLLRSPIETFPETSLQIFVGSTQKSNKPMIHVNLKCVTCG